MKRPIQVGDKVSAEWFQFTSSTFTASLKLKKVVGEFMGLDDAGFAKVGNKNEVRLCSPKSLRRLIPKKDTRRRWWINLYEGSLDVDAAYTSKEKADKYASLHRISCVEVVEVRKKKNEG